MALISFVSSTDRQGRLMLAYARGDNAAFTELYEHYRAELYRYFLRHCGSKALAEELYQELWMRVIRNRERYEHKARFSTWLYSIAANLLKDHYRRGERWQVETETAEPEAGADADPGALYTAGEKAARIMRVLRALPEEQRQAFLLKEEADLSLDEIAEVTGCNRETAKSRLRYAVRKLREALAEDAA